MGVVFQIVGEDGDQSIGSSSGSRKKRSDMVMTAEEQSRRDAMDMRCLSLCIGMLERVNGVHCHPFHRHSGSDAHLIRPLKRIQRSKAFLASSSSPLSGTKSNTFARRA